MGEMPEDPGSVTGERNEVNPAELPSDGGVRIEAETVETQVNVHWELTKFGIAMGFLSGVAATVLFYEYVMPILF